MKTSKSKALADCYMMARRQLARLKREYPEDAQSIAAWGHVVRFCEQAGDKTSILRESLPTEITNG